MSYTNAEAAAATAATAAMPLCGDAGHDSGAGLPRSDDRRRRVAEPPIRPASRTARPLGPPPTGGSATAELGLALLDECAGSFPVTLGQSGVNMVRRPRRPRCAFAGTAR
jgi:hypothetical protein